MLFCKYGFKYLKSFFNKMCFIGFLYYPLKSLKYLWGCCIPVLRVHCSKVDDCSRRRPEGFFQ